MAQVGLRLAENVAGELFVDESCIDCDTCRQVAPEVYQRGRRGMSVVARQPRSADERERALLALVACPTASIGQERDPRASQVEAAARRAELVRAARVFPIQIDGPVHYCGYAAESSYGASSYLLLREQPGGNVLIDSPRAAAPLVARIRQLGGAGLMFLTHRDDVADHATWRDELGCARVLHGDDVGSRTRGVERVLSGRDPIELAPGLIAIPVPGHTRGSCALLVDRTWLFTGDHLWADEEGRLEAGREVCWYSWDEQVRSLRRLLEFDFTWVLPGHGRRFHAKSPESMREELRALLRRL